MRMIRHGSSPRRPHHVPRCGRSRERAGELAAQPGVLVHASCWLRWRAVVRRATDSEVGQRAPNEPSACSETAVVVVTDGDRFQLFFRLREGALRNGAGSGVVVIEREVILVRHFGITLPRYHLDLVDAGGGHQVAGTTRAAWESRSREVVLAGRRAGLVSGICHRRQELFLSLGLADFGACKASDAAAAAPRSRCRVSRARRGGIARF